MLQHTWSWWAFLIEEATFWGVLWDSIVTSGPISPPEVRQITLLINRVRTINGLLLTFTHPKRIKLVDIIQILREHLSQRIYIVCFVLANYWFPDTVVSPIFSILKEAIPERWCRWQLPFDRTPQLWNCPTRRDRTLLSRRICQHPPTSPHPLTNLENLMYIHVP